MLAMGRGPRATKETAGTVVRRTRWAPAQRVRAHQQWCDEDEELFLDCLAATCNVTLACEQADVSHTTVYRQRRSGPTSRSNGRPRSNRVMPRSRWGWSRPPTAR